MSLYLRLDHTMTHIGDFLLDRELTIGMEEEWTSLRLKFDGRSILFPFIHQAKPFVGNPHARIEPVSERLAHYTPLYQPEGQRLEALFPGRMITLNRNRPYEIALDSSGKSPIILIERGLFTLRLTDKNVIGDKYTTRLR